MSAIRSHRLILASIVLLAALVATGVHVLLAQERHEALRGTWSGSWEPDGRYDAATVRFSVDGETLSGELVNPEPVELSTIVFDAERLTLVAEGVSDDRVHARIDARIEETTRLNGTLVIGDVGGDIKLVKWTFRP